MTEQIDIPYTAWITACKDMKLKSQAVAHNTGDVKIVTVLAKSMNITDLLNFIDLECIAPDCSCDLSVSILIPSDEPVLFPIPPGFDFVREDYDMTNMEMVGGRLQKAADKRSS